MAKDKNSTSIDGGSVENKLSYFSSYSKIFLFLFLGLSLFFISGFVIISLSVSSRKPVGVPALVGKLFLDKHNNLQDLGFKVELEWQHTTTYPYGYIFAQSISPGQVAKAGTKLVLLVNQSRNVIPIPNLVGKSIDLVENILKTNHIGSRNFSLVKGVITMVPDSAQKGEVLAQFPPAGTKVIPNSPVSMLVSSGPKSMKTSFVLPNFKKQGQNLNIIKQFGYRKKIAVKFNFKKVENIANHGRVIDAKLENLPSKKMNWQKLEESSDNYLLAVTAGKYNFKDKIQNTSFQNTYVSNEDLDLPPGKYTLVVKSYDLNYSKAQLGTGSVSKKEIGFSLKEKIDSIEYVQINQPSDIIDVFQGFKGKLEIWKSHINERIIRNEDEEDELVDDKKDDVPKTKVKTSIKNDGKGKQKSVFDEIKEKNIKVKVKKIKPKPLKIVELDQINV